MPEDRVTAQGMGSTQPVADNKTANGRAHNRRVEIILDGSAKAPRTPTMPGGGQDNVKPQ